MPILKPPSPLLTPEDSLDPGLEYLESQRSWEHRRPADNERVQRFYQEENENPERIDRTKKYPYAERIILEPNWSLLEMSFLEVLSSRQTRRTGGGRAISLETVSTYFLSAFGKQSELPGALPDPGRPHSRTTPSPGALFSSEVYFFSLNVQGLQKGLYHFRPDEGTFEILDHDLPEDPFCLIPSKDVEEQRDQVAGFVFVTSVFHRMRRKYGHRYLRFCLLEAGALCQNLDLAAAALDLGFWHLGSVDEKSARALLNIDGHRESVVSAGILMAGIPEKERSK